MHDRDLIFNNLRNFKIFNQLKDNELKKIIPFFSERKFKKGERIVRQNDSHLGCCFLISGKVKAYNKVFGEHKCILATLSKNETFGGVSMLDGGVSLVNIDAIEDSLCYSLSDSYFNDIKIIFPPIAINIAKNIATQICARIRKVVSENSSNMLLEAGTVKKTNNNLFFTHNLSTKIEDNMHLIKYFDIYKQLEHDKFFELLKYAKWQKIPKSQIIYSQGNQFTEEIHLIVNGAVGLMLNSSNSYAKLNVLGPGDIFGHVAYLDNQAHYSTAFAREDLLLLTFAQTKLRKLKEIDYILYNKFLLFVISMLGPLLRAADKQTTRIIAMKNKL